MHAGLFTNNHDQKLYPCLLGCCCQIYRIQIRLRGRFRLDQNCSRLSEFETNPQLHLLKKKKKDFPQNLLRWICAAHAVSFTPSLPECGNSPLKRHFCVVLRSQGEPSSIRGIQRRTLHTEPACPSNSAGLSRRRFYWRVSLTGCELGRLRPLRRARSNTSQKREIKNYQKKNPTTRKRQSYLRLARKAAPIGCVVEVVKDALLLWM